MGGLSTALRPIDVLLLGPVEVRLHGGSLPLGRRKQRALLALLACTANRVVTVERIVDELWPEEPPASARHSVEVYASGLRKLLGPGRLERRGGGYVLELDPAELDAERLASLVEQAQGARPARARRLLEQGLALVRGEPLADLDGLPFVQVERARLGELVATAREALVEARLALGEHEALVPGLRARCAAEPTGERARAQLMLALYRAGRQQEALTAYRDGRGALRDQLGVEPAPALRELERRILQHDPSLAAPPTPAPPANLPAPLHPLIGRERELAELASLLRSDARLVTLIGVGGVGKTRLALALGHELWPEFQDGACFVALAPVRDPALVASVIAQALAVAEAPGEALAETLARHLRERETLLVVDNVEHLLEGAPLLTELLAACPDLRVLATSRAPLRLYGEHRYLLEPLELPPSGADAAAVARAPSVSLFAARSRAVRPDFAVSGENADSLAAICRRLDGLPLAIELAAARSALLAPEVLLARLTSRLDAGEGPRDAPERQRALRSTLAWSYDLLGPGEQALFRRLGVFRGGCTVSGAQAVAGTRSGRAPDVAAGLDALVQHNLLRRLDTAEVEVRYSMLETIREYALERLAASGEADAVRERHAKHFAGVVQKAPAMPGREFAGWFDRLAPDLDNVRAAADWAAAKHPDYLLRLTAPIWYVWSEYPEEGARRLTQALALQSEESPELRARALNGVALIAFQTGDYDRAMCVAEEARVLGDGVGDLRASGCALITLGSTLRDQGSFDYAYARHEEALERFRAAGDSWGIARSMFSLGLCAHARGDERAAGAHLEEALSLFRIVGDVVSASQSAVRLAEVVLSKNPRRARSLFEESLSCLRASPLSDQDTIALCLLGLADVAAAESDVALARERLREALAIFAGVGQRLWIAISLERLASVESELGERPIAPRLLGAADAIREQLGAPVAPAERERYGRGLALAAGDTFAAEWERGRAMSAEQAVALALDRAPDPVVSPRRAALA